MEKENKKKWKFGNYEWHIVGGVAILTFIIGVQGFLPDRDLFDSVYLTIQLFLMQYGDNGGTININIQVARFVAPLIVAYATIKSVYSLFQKDLGLIFIKDHVVICGLSDESMKLLNDLMSRKIKTVLIENSSVKHNLMNLKTEGALLINANPSDIPALSKAKVGRAKAVFLLNEKDEFNIEIVSNIYKLFGEEKSDKRVLCYVHIYDPVLERIFKAHKIFREPSDKLYARVGNIYKRGSEILINDYFLTGKNSGSQNERIMIIGMGRTGKSILIQSALFYHSSRGEKLKATIIDRYASASVNRFKNEYPSVFKLLDLDYSELEMGKLDDDNFYSKLPGENYKAIYCCAGEDILRISVIEKLNTILPETRLFVTFEKNSDVSKLINEGDIFKNEDRIITFDLLEKTCKYNVLINEEIENLAIRIHEKFCDYLRGMGETQESKPFLVNWDLLGEEFREANRNQAFHMKLKLETFGFRIVPLDSPEPAVNILKNEELIEKMARAEHRRWVDEILLNGWRYAQGEMDEKKKTRPDILPYDVTSEEIRNINRQMVCNIPQHIENMGKKIVRAGE